MWSWFQRMFMSRMDDDEDAGMEDEQSSFLRSQHLRIIIAMLFVFFSGIVMWWILE